MTARPEYPPGGVYATHDLRLRSEIPLPGLRLDTSEPNVLIRRSQIIGTSRYRPLEHIPLIKRPIADVRATVGHFFVAWSGYGNCLISEGKEIHLDLDPGVEIDQFKPFISGTGIAVLLHQRGNVVLHGSCVSIDGSGVVFLGEKGAGKSTLAAHLQKRGHKLISDDLVPVAIAGGQVETTTSGNIIRLFPDSLASLDIEPATLPLVHRLLNKRYLIDDQNIVPVTVPIKCICILKVSDSIRVMRLPRANSFVELTRHTYLNRYIEATGTTAEYFSTNARVTDMVPVVSLERPHDFGLIERVIETIEMYVSPFV